MIGHPTHQKREQAAANYTHDNERRSLLGWFPQIFQTQTKNSGEHDAKKEIDHDQRNEWYGAEVLSDDEAH